MHPSSTRSFTAGPRRATLAATWPAGVALSFVVGLLLYQFAHQAVEDDARRRFDSVAQLARERVSTAIASYARVVRGLTSLHTAGEGPLARLHFHRYVATLDLPREFPALEAVSFVAHVPDAARDAFVSEIDVALSKADAAAAAAVAHRVKSSARVIGAGAFAAVCEELESQAGRPAQARALAARLRAKLVRIERNITAQLGLRADDRR